MPVFMNNSDSPSFSHWNNKPVTILSVICDPNDTTHLDPVSMPQFLVKLDETGEENTTYPDEISEEFWPEEMKWVLNGMNHPDNPPADALMTPFFEKGIQLAAIKNSY